MQAQALKRLAFLVKGVVQGVGYRPFVYEIASRLGLSGFVRNTNAGLEIEVQGPQDRLERFQSFLLDEIPPLARVASLERFERTPVDETGFRIELSNSGSASTGNFVAADSATCEPCLNELFDPHNRRFRYPFINCTNCGPRFSIIKSLPYDRETSTMSAFQLCQECQKEYDNPANRRFHAQPNACANCGPQISFHAADEVHYKDEAIKKALECIRAGQIIAVKGLSGFHLVCDASNNNVVQLLRSRKNRPHKPFAVMMRDLDMLKQYCKISSDEQHFLCSPESPIVLLSSLGQQNLAESVAPEQHKLGILLPYTPIQHLILRDYNQPLIFTSANRGEEPIVINLHDATEKLKGIADAFLDNNRDIHARYDDSVLQVIDSNISMLRRSRGFAPLPIKIPISARASVLAFGGQLKNTFCFIRERQAYLSSHIGDLENLDTEEFLMQSVKHYVKLFQLEPELIACDEHPSYLSRDLAHRFAKQRNLPCISVQHHHAHIVSCMIENLITEPCLGVAFDGLGYGSDETLWGGEFLLCRLDSFERLAHFENVPMPGSTQAILQPWRMALSFILRLPENEQSNFSFIDKLSSIYDSQTIKLVTNQIKSNFNSPLSSSCGRFLDAVSALLGICQSISYEGQAAIELESRAWKYIGCKKMEDLATLFLDCYEFKIETSSETWIVETSAVIQAVNSDIQKGVSVNQIAAQVHASLAKLLYYVLSRLRIKTGINSICFSGGVFQNKLLLKLTEAILRNEGFNLYFHHQVPANDGGLSLGQAVVALAKCDLLD